MKKEALIGVLDRADKRRWVSNGTPYLGRKVLFYGSQTARGRQLKHSPQFRRTNASFGI